jgi:hypothetical protein
VSGPGAVEPNINPGAALSSAARRVRHKGGRPPEENIADLVKKVQGAFRQENAQGGQLTSQSQIADENEGVSGRDR